MLPKNPLITPNSFHAPPSKPSPTPQPPVTVFFISGNPGLIGYYHAFLSLLSAHLAGSHSDRPPFQIYGRSLGGFELGGSAAGCYYDLEDQICFVMRDLDRLMREGQNGNATAAADATAPNGKRKVVLVGHSVGSYIAMEVLRRHRETGAEADFQIAGGVMLFPTVVDIAKSPAGRKLTRILSFIPHLALLASLLAALVTYLLPDPILRFLVGAAMGSPPDEVVDTTLSFLKSKRGVRQAIYMGADEMQTITTDKWADDIWGIGTGSDASAENPTPRLVFYFGQNDHWVAEQTRDEIMALRGRKGSNGGGPRMLVCEDRVPHAFCLRHSGVMAGKVAGMIGDVVAGKEWC